MKIQESTEDYLERILILHKELEQVRAIDIARSMNYSKPTISIALKKLRESGNVTVDRSGNVTLTEQGLAVAQKTYEKHTVIADLLMRLGVSEKTACEDSCHIEHCLSDESFEAIKSCLKEHPELSGSES